MVVVAVTVNQLLQVVENLELAEKLLDAFVARREDTQPADKLTNHRLIDALLREEPLRSRGSNSINLELSLLVGSITSHMVIWHSVAEARHRLIATVLVARADLRVADHAATELRRHLLQIS